MKLNQYQSQIDQLAFDLYGISFEDRLSIGAAFHEEDGVDSSDGAAADSEEVNYDEAPMLQFSADRASLAADLVSYAIGCVFGRWDVRVAIDPILPSSSRNPFHPLPACSPGMLVGLDGAPAIEGGIVSEEWLRAKLTGPSTPYFEARGNAVIADSEYPLQISWDGILVDDKGHPKDIVEQIRAVFSLLWGNQTDEFEKQILQALNASDLREYLRSPKGFFDHHIRGYSKGQRKAPIYWLLQSDRQGYSVMIYYHRYGREILHRVLGDYVKPKIRFEERRFQEIQQKIVAAEGNGEAREARDLSRILEKQEGLLEELRRFQLEIARITDLNVVPDLDDGVILNLATCHQITPWMESKSFGMIWSLASTPGQRFLRTFEPKG